MILDPRRFTFFSEWASAMNEEMFLPDSRLFSDWKSWANQVISTQEQAPDPRLFSIWSDWAIRWMETQT